MTIKTPRLVRLLVLAAGILPSLEAAERMVVTASQSLASARPGEVISVAWADVIRLMPEARPEKLMVRDSSGASLPYQFTNFHPEDKRGVYNDILFQHDFAAGEMSATFTIERLAAPAPPFPARVFARYVPERFDDFAWENDHIAHRIYGPGLDTPAAGISQLVSSGIDVWAKRVNYLIVDRWYIRGHNNYHKDNGEGYDFYSVGTGRGDGGSGIWDGKAIHVSHNWSSWKVLANGPIRAIFELGYAPWDAGNEVMVSEVKRFTVDAGRNLDQMDSTFTFTGPGEITAAFGIGKHPKSKMDFISASDGTWLSEWEEYPEQPGAGLGTGLVMSKGESAGQAEDELNHLDLVKVRSGVPVRYYTGAGWTRSGDFSTEAGWQAYLAAFAERINSPVTVTVN